MTPDEAAVSYKIQDLTNELAEANALAERCSNENVALRLQLSTALQREADLADLLDDIRLYTRLHHMTVTDAMIGLRRMLDAHTLRL